MKPITFREFEALTDAKKRRLVKKYLGIAVEDGVLCGYNTDTLITGKPLGSGWQKPDPGDVILAEHPTYWYATFLSLDAINSLRCPR